MGVSSMVKDKIEAVLQEITRDKTMFRIPTYNNISAVFSLKDTTKDNTKLTTMFRIPPLLANNY